MKTRPSGTIKTFIGMVGAMIANFFRAPGTPYVGYGEEPWRHKGARKSSGGKTSSRVRTPHYRAWKKAFGGLAVPAHVG